MKKKPARKKGYNVFAWLTHLQHVSVRRQIEFICGAMLVVMSLCGAILGMVSYETTQDYHASMQAVSDIYELNNSLEVLDVMLEEYILNATELKQRECEEQWEVIGRQLGKFYTGNQESGSLALANIRAIYQYTQADMEAMLIADSNAGRGSCYAVLSARKEGMLFLTEQLLRFHIETDVENYPKIISRNLGALGIFFSILLVSFILLITCSMRMIRAVCTPIDLLVADAKQIAEGHYDTQAVAILNDDELGYLSQVFNDMKKQVCANFKSMERIIELQNLLQDAELKALQAQINPHFLLNVLSVAEEAALCENANQTVEVMENISYMLQYSLKCTRQDTMIQEELRMVQAYLFLQEKRFGDRIRLVFTLEEAVPPLTIPGMSLQPVVENAIRHGVEKMEQDGIVQVQVQRRPGHIEVTISDNGCGIDPELLAAIRRKESIQSRNGTGGIGLVNVCRRMELFYKRTGLFEIESLPGQGTTVILRYPYAESEELDV